MRIRHSGSAGKKASPRQNAQGDGVFQDRQQRESGKEMQPEHGKRHGAQKGGQHAQNGKLHDAAGAQARCQHDEAAATGKVVQQEGRGVLSDKACGKKNDNLHEKLRNAENADDGAGVGRDEQRRGKVQQRLDDEQGRIAGETFLHGAEEAQAAAGEHHQKDGKLLAHVFERGVLPFSDAAEGRGHFMGDAHDEVFQPEHLADERSEQQGAYDRGKGLSLAYHEDAHADIDAAEDEHEILAKGFSKQSSDVAADDGAEKNAGRVDFRTEHVFSPCFTRDALGKRTGYLTGR